MPSCWTNSPLSLSLSVSLCMCVCEWGAEDNTHKCKRARTHTQALADIPTHTLALPPPPPLLYHCITPMSLQSSCCWEPRAHWLTDWLLHSRSALPTTLTRPTGTHPAEESRGTGCRWRCPREREESPELLHRQTAAQTRLSAGLQSVK